MVRQRAAGSIGGGLVTSALALAATFALYVTCTAPRAQADATTRPAEDSLSVVWAGSDYAVHEPPGAVVALHVVARNTTNVPTQTTTIRWSPEFAHAFSFLTSDPPATNALVDGAGWGVAQMGGLPAREDTGIALWFSVADGAHLPANDLFPRVQVVADETRAVGERLAIPLHAPERLRLRAQHALDRSAVAQLVEHATFVPATSHGVFGLAVSFSVLLLVVTVAGVATTIRVTGRTA